MALITTQDKIFHLKAGESLLEGLERTGHEVEYQCRSGYCGACRIKILSGRVHYNEQPMAFIGPSEILPCCCSVREPIELDCKLRDCEYDFVDDDWFASL